MFLLCRYSLLLRATDCVILFPFFTGKQLNESCTFNAQCADSDRNMECRDQVCQCAYDFKPTFYIGGNIVCTSKYRLTISL